METREFIRVARVAVEEDVEVKKSDFSRGGDISDGGLSGRTDVCVEGAEYCLEAPPVDVLLCGVRELLLRWGAFV